jgi:predicted ester cyclase
MDSMSDNADTPGAIARRWYDGLWNDDDESTIDALLAPECCVHGLDESPIRSAETFKGFYRNIIATFPKLSAHIERVVTDGEQASGMVTIDATHAKSGKSVRFETVFFMRCKDGKIVEAWNLVDWVPLLLASGTISPDGFAAVFGPA